MARHSSHASQSDRHAITAARQHASRQLATPSWRPRHAQINGWATDVVTAYLPGGMWVRFRVTLGCWHTCRRHPLFEPSRDATTQVEPVLWKRKDSCNGMPCRPLRLAAQQSFRARTEAGPFTQDLLLMASCCETALHACRSKGCVDQQKATRIVALRYIHCMGMRTNCYLSSVILLSVTREMKLAESHDPISLDVDRIDPPVTVQLARRID